MEAVKRTDGDGPENESAGDLFATLSTGRRSAAVDLEIHSSFFDAAVVRKHDKQTHEETGGYRDGHAGISSYVQYSVRHELRQSCNVTCLLPITLL